MRARRVLLRAGVAVAALAAAAAAAAALFSARPQGGPPGAVVGVEIPAGSSAREVAARLAEAGVSRPAWLVSALMRISGVSRRVKAGRYAFELPVAPAEVLRALARGRVATFPVTVPEGLTVEEVAKLLAREGFADEEALLEAFRDPRPIRDLAPAAETLEGYLFPETYRFPKPYDARRIAAEMVATFRTRFAEPHAAEIAASKLSLHEIVTLASLVEKETAVAEERPLIAGVYLERLERGMRLQCDPTVIYALKRAGKWDGNIRRADLRRDDPYNTYVRVGLPPGPIASPGLDALIAALNPVRSGALYFVSRGDGTHVFSRTLAEHNRAVRRFLSRR
ncbi:MAG: endolytic transglycosylase MltG [Acidobacteria bacterium]|nr:MAG: endolytic transglycosylase MltG [Acidobacteriota bacterium]